MSEIVIVYAFSGELYAKLTYISMSSVLLNNCKRKIKFVLLVDKEYHDEESIFGNLNTTFENYEIDFLSIDESVFEYAELHIPHINHATYFRLILPEILPTVDKCLYLDCDTIVNADISELYDLELGNCLIAGVLGPGYLNNPKCDSYCECVGLPDLNTYINAGVLLFNLDMMRKENTSLEFMKLISSQYPSQDQDIINKVCYGRILQLPLKYNVMTKYAEWDISDYGINFNKDELISAWNFPAIIHYADRIKPWDEPDSYLASEWWEICSKTALINDFIFRVGKYHTYESLYNSSKLVDEKIKKKVPNLYSLRNKRIVLYGAGNFANAFLNLYRPLGIVPEFIIVTTNTNSMEFLEGIEIKELKDISFDSSEFSLVLAMNYRFQKQVMSELSKYHFREILPLTDKMLSIEKEYMNGK